MHISKGSAADSNTYEYRQLVENLAQYAEACTEF
jgi:hypothetical protein